MASLNTLRTKFGVLLSIIIALALLAFVFSLKTEMGFSGNDPRVGEIDGQTINYSEYLQQYEQIKQQNNIQESNEEQTEMLANAVWQSLFAKHVLTPGFTEMGIRFTNAERLAILSGQYPSQVLYNAFADQRTGAYNPTAVTEFLAQAETNVQAQQAWGQLIDQMRIEREIQQYMGLVRGGAYINALEVTQGVAAANNTYAGKWVGKKYAAVADSLVAVSSGDLKTYYNTHKNMFRQTPSRTLSYVVFEVNPTDADMLALEKTATEVGAQFASAEDVKTFVRANRNGRIADRFVSVAQLPEDEAIVLTEGQMYGPVLKNNEWTMTRVLDSKVVADSIGVRHIVLPSSQEALADSLLTVIKRGDDFAQLAAQYSVYEQTAAAGGEVGVMPFSAFTGEFATALAGANAGDVVKVASGDAIQLMQVYRADKPVKQLLLATITYPVEASEATRREAHNLAGTFTVTAKGSAESFTEAASTASITPRVAALQQGERTIRGMEDSREVARWVYEAKVGDLSEIFSSGKDYVVAMLTEIDDKEFASPEKVSAQLRAQVLRDKKYDYLSKQLSGATLEEQGVSLGAEVADFDGVNYASFFVNGPGMEPRLVGAISSSEKGAVSAPVKGLSGVYVFRVDNIQTAQTQTPEGEKVRAQAMAEGMAMQFVMPAMQEMAQMKDLRGKFF